MAEQQRAKSEIEAALTIAAAKPRDEKRAVARILNACQRPGLAERAQYRYSRGGTDICGASIDLLEVCAQHWGNIEFGFRELARYPGEGNKPGESVVEAFAWDLETNTRRRTQFTVQHAMKAGGRTKTLTDPRDIYEFIANHAQRRVRTCLENLIPRDIVEDACGECDKTLQASINDIGKASSEMAKAFASIGVTKEMIEGRIQRSIASITAAQIIGLRKVYKSIKDGLSEPSDWFAAPEAQDNTPKASAADKAKAAMREKAQARQQEQPIDAPSEPAEHEAAEPLQEPEPQAESEAYNLAQFLIDLESQERVGDINEMHKGIPATWNQQDRDKAELACLNRIEAIRGNRGPRSNQKSMLPGTTTR